MNSLYLRHAYNDLVRNKAVNAALVVILMLSAFLMATGAMVMERLVGSVDQLFEQGRPPHFLQMHQGDYDQSALQRFADGRPEIDAWLIEEMLGVDGAAIGWVRPSTGESGDFGDSLIDNLFVTQNQAFDFLIDESGAIAQPAPGEVYVPVAYQQEFGLAVGDRLELSTATGVIGLQVQGFVRDSQMAASMSSGTRFLISESDFAQLGRAGGALPEIIVEYRLTDPALISQFQRAYEADPTVPKDGQAVTVVMIRMLNAFSDGLVAIALIVVSLVLIAIALLCVRFVIRGTVLDEIAEIGAMKAIGLPGREITRLYLIKYTILTMVACALGGGLAVIATHLLTSSIRVHYAEAAPGALTVVVPLLALALVHLFVIGTCHRVLSRVAKVEVVTALVHGSTSDARPRRRRTSRFGGRWGRANLAGYRGQRINRWLMWSELRAEGRHWVLIPIVFFLVAVVVTLPMNLLNTFTSPRFVTYMGAPQYDVLAEIRSGGSADAVRSDLQAAIAADERLSDPVVFADELYTVQGPEGPETLQVEIGDYSGDTVAFTDGGRPDRGQIAVSALNADKFGVGVGDSMIIQHDGERSRVVVSGVYPDLTSGGYTAKLQGEVPSGALGYVIYADAAEGVDVDRVAAAYDDRFPDATVLPMQEYLNQTLSYLTDALRSLVVVAVIFGIGVAVLITSLFLELRLAGERPKFGVLSAIGFSVAELMAQIRGKVIIAVLSGTLLGLLFSATAGESLVGGLLSLTGLGITRLEFLPNPLLTYLALPLLLVGAGYLAAVLLTRRLRSADTSRWLTR